MALTFTIGALDFLKRKPNFINASYSFLIPAPDLNFICGSSLGLHLLSNKTVISLHRFEDLNQEPRQKGKSN